MEILELRIGNYLFDRENRICIVDKIENRRKDYEEDQLFKAPAIKGGITSLPNKPIPLTEEWLIKFGFHKDFIGEFIFPFNNHNSAYGIVEYSGKYALTYSGDVTKETFVKYVHQLQNLYYALTGEELKK